MTTQSCGVRRRGLQRAAAFSWIGSAHTLHAELEAAIRVEGSRR